MFSFSLWVSVVVFTCLGLAMGIVCLAFSLLNAGTRPIETITGPMGLYLWNSLAGTETQRKFSWIDIRAIASILENLKSQSCS